MRPINRASATAVAYVEPAVLDFTAHPKAAVMQRVFNTTSPSRTDCLELWDSDVSAASSLSQDEQDALTAIQQRVGDLYKRAASSLNDAFGGFCAYCEVPLQNSFDVEHVVPKSEYPTFALSWDNFLPACNACNSRKRAKPVRSDVVGSLGMQSPTPADYKNEIRNKRYRWPDLEDTYHLIGYELEYLDRVSPTWTPCSAADAVAAGNQYVAESSELAEVYADLPALSLNRVPVRVTVVPRPGDNRATKMVELCGLDAYARPAKLGDRRSTHRTKAWLTAVEWWHTQVPDPTSPPTTLPSTFKTIAASVGFYSVWLTVAAAIDSSLAALFVNELQLRFPGTDLTKVP